MKKMMRRCSILLFSRHLFHLRFLLSPVILDLKGCQYSGTLYPGPTAMVLALVNNNNNLNGNNSNEKKDPQLKVDGMTNEFCRLVRTGDAMAKLNATVHGDVKSEYYRFEDEDVNKTTTTSNGNNNSMSTKSKSEADIIMHVEKGSSKSLKRKSTATKISSSTKKRKSNVKRK
jgi:hypothetical protein